MQQDHFHGPCLLYIVLFALFLLISLIMASRRLHTPARRLAEIIAPPSLVAFMTASSIAAFQSSMETGKEKLGIDPSFFQFAYPIGNVMFMPGAAICLTVFSVYFAIQYGVAVNASWLIAAVFIPSLLAIAVPPLPGSGLMIFSTMYAQLGIPAEALLLTTLMYVVLDHFGAGGDIAALLIELTQEAGDLHRSDRNIKE